MHRIAFLASHNGSSARAITDACLSGFLPAEPVLMISNNPDAAAIAWARELNLETAVINVKNSADPDTAIADILEDHAIDIVACSGYMKLIGPKTIAAARGAVLNVHPALLPNYGGQGMYGSRVHQAVFDNKDAETGITIHLVDGEYDHGRIVAQKRIAVDAGAGVAGIEAAVKKAEPDFYVETLHKILSGLIDL